MVSSHVLFLFVYSVRGERWRTTPSRSGAGGSIHAASWGAVHNGLHSKLRLTSFRRFGVSLTRSTLPKAFLHPHKGWEAKECDQGP
jgi:hypothetical protein